MSNAWKDRFKVAWRVKAFNMQPHKVIRLFGPGCDEVWVYAALDQPKRNEQGQENESILLVKVPVSSTQGGRAAEDRAFWHLPGGYCYSNDPSVLWRLYIRVFADTNLTITKFTSVISREMVLIDDANGQERKILVLTFGAEYERGGDLILTKPKYSAST